MRCWFALSVAVSACHGTPMATPADAALPDALPDAPPTLLVDETLTITVGGIERTILVHAPADRPQQAALILNMHPTAGTSVKQAALTHMSEFADQAKFIVAYPQGALKYSTGYEWHVPGESVLSSGGVPPPNAPDDVEFLHEAILAIEGQLGVDPTKIFTTGFSGGARIASAAGCKLPEVSGIAPVAGVRFADPCDLHPVKVVAIHGTADPNDSYWGPGRAYWTYGVQQAMTYWSDHEGCAAPTVVTPIPMVDVSTYASCATGVELQLYTLWGKGHEWPTVIDPNPIMWDAFNR